MAEDPRQAFKVAETVDDIRERRAPMAADDAVCPHGHAMDVHCCGCHSGFLFDPDSCICEELTDYMAANPSTSLEEAIEIVNDARVEADEARRLAGCE